MEFEQSEKDNLLALLEVYKQRLAERLHQRAIHGLANTPSIISFEIRECQENISTIVGKLQELDPIAFQDLTLYGMNTLIDYAPVDLLVGEMSIAFDRFYQSWVAQVKKQALSKLQALQDVSIGTKMGYSTERRPQIIQSMNNEISEYVNSIHDITKPERSIFLGEVSILMAKYKLSPLGYFEEIAFENILTPVFTIEIPEELKEKTASAVIYTVGGYLVGTAAAIALPVVGGFIVGLVGAWGGGMRKAVVEYDALLNVYKIHTTNLLEQYSRELKATEYDAINYIIKHCIDR